MINPGTRPSRLALGRHATGEASTDVSDVSSRAYLDAVEAERMRVEPFDFAVLRARAARLDDAPARPAPAPVPWWRRLLLVAPVLAVAAALFVVSRPDVSNRVKGEADLGFYVLRGDTVLPGDPDGVFRAGDRLQFTYRSSRERLVFLSLDGEGRLTLYYPEAGEDGVAVIPGGRHVLDGSIILDDAPGPEVFLAFFGADWGVTRAEAVARKAWATGGTAGLVALAGDDPDIAALALEKP